MPWKHNVWIDDDGSLTVGTPYDAEHMNNIELGIAEDHDQALAASGMAGSALVTAASGVAAAGSALVTGQQANARAASGVTAAGSALRTGQDARAAAGSALADIVVIDQFTAGSGMGFVFHGSSAAIARPSGVGGVLWVGSVEPSNAKATDPWISTNVGPVTREPKNWGEVTSLPSEPMIGDRCTYKYDPSGEQEQFNPGVLAYWDFEYDGVTPFPWKCIGGQWAMQTLVSIAAATSKTFISTGAPALSTPFAEADYDIEFGCPSLVNNVASNSGNIVMKLKNESVSEFIEGALLLTSRLAASTTQGGFWARGRVNVREPLAGVKLQLFYAVEAGTSVTFTSPSLRLRPRRVKA